MAKPLHKSSRGLQPSVTRMEWLRHSGLAGGCALRGVCLPAGGAGVCVVRGVTCGVSEGREDPRGKCGVPIGTLLWSGLIRGLQTLGYSCGVASPLWPCGVMHPLRERLRRYALRGTSAFGGWRVSLLAGVWCGVGRQGFGVWWAVCVPMVGERAGRVACRRGVYLRVRGMSGEAAPQE